MPMPILRPDADSVRLQKSATHGRVHVLKACLALDDVALAWVCSQLLALRGPVLQKAVAGRHALIDAASPTAEVNGEKEQKQVLQLSDTRLKSEAPEEATTPSKSDALKPNASAGEAHVPVPPPEPSDPAQDPVPVKEVALEVEVEVEEPAKEPTTASPRKRKGEVKTQQKYVNGCLPIPSKESKAGQFLDASARCCAPILNSVVFKVVLVICVIIALFGGGLITLLDIPDDPGILVMDVLMCAVTVLFTAELLMNCVVDYRHYPLSFFFWMDLVGTFSMMFEISWLLGSAGKMQTDTGGSLDTVVMRTARAAKVGARAGRLSKIMKMMDVSSADEANIEAKVLSGKLMLALSTRVSALTILLVLFLPVFSIGQYPEVDLSMLKWSEALEDALKRTYDAQIALPGQTSTIFRDTVTNMIDFYSFESYRPFRIEGFGEEVTVGGQQMLIQGAALLDLPTPVQLSNVYVQELTQCSLARESCSDGQMPKLYFDFKGPRQLEASMDIGTIIFIVLCMVVISIILSYTLDAMVIQPMERMLTSVVTLAGDILKQFGMDDMEQEQGVEETALIETIFKKFAKLASLAAQRNEITDDDLKGLDAESKGVMLQMLNVQTDRKKKYSVAGNLRMQEVALATLPVETAVIDSWNFNVLDLQPDENGQVALHLFFDSRLGRSTGRAWTDQATFSHFHDMVRSNYNELPYHNYAHAIDVTHTVYRLLSLTATDKWLSTVEQYALLVAAMCHDLGHQGKTNQFLVETHHELALTYNDKSPLENMHSAKLFEICALEGADMFSRMDAEAKKMARKVCIAAILHTDNANHFEMVKETSKIYELASDLCDEQAPFAEGEIEQTYQEQVLQKNSLLWLELFLHFSDVSNPLKPFNICHAWAWRVLDEFFDQGDVEKQLGIPVGMLNDRAKINRPGSQHGFINFMVAPFVHNTVKLFPVLHPVYTQMANNLQQWRDLWVEDVRPGQEDIAKKDADVQKVKGIAQELETRTLATTRVSMSG